MFQGKEEPRYHVSQAQYIPTDSRGSSKHYAGQQQNPYGNLPVLELTVPMCCAKCEEKVKEELEELSGVRNVITDQSSQKVTVIGHVDPLLALKKVKKVKKKSKFFSSGTYISGMIPHSAPVSTGTTTYTGQGYVHGSSDGAGLTRSNSFGRRLGRQPSFAKVVRYQDHEIPRLRHDDFEHRTDGYRHEFSRVEPAHHPSQRDFYGVRRMPSFNKHRHHDAEYISMDDRYHTTSSPYVNGRGDSHYVSHHSQRPAFHSQVSFSKLPVTNPHYMKHLAAEYWKQLARREERKKTKTNFTITSSRRRRRRREFCHHVIWYYCGVGLCMEVGGVAKEASVFFQWIGLRVFLWCQGMKLLVSRTLHGTHMDSPWDACAEVCMKFHHGLLVDSPELRSFRIYCPLV